MFLVSSSSCLCPTHWSQVLSREWSSAPTTYERSTVLLPTKSYLILEVWWYSLRPWHYTRELHLSHNTCLWLVPSHFQQITHEMSVTGVTSVFSKYSIFFCRQCMNVITIHDWQTGVIGPQPSLIRMMTSSNGNIFRVTGLLCGISPVTSEFPAQRPVTWSFDVFFDLRLIKRLSK